ncbi:MAG: hypothetical protein [Podoviridae sp. ctrTa16]|nr:MAG: hypothetical protein [Podoviridae sp. ctrTa16]
MKKYLVAACIKCILHPKCTRNVHNFKHNTLKSINYEKST